LGKDEFGRGFPLARDGIGGLNMPVITIETTELTKEQKSRIVDLFTRNASEITGIPEQAFTIIFHEIPRENFGVGRVLLSEIKD